MRLSPEDAMARLTEFGPCTEETAQDRYELIFAPWVKAQGLEFVSIEPGRVVARLPQNEKQQFFTGAMCGQAFMSAVDTVMSMAMSTGERAPRGTASQNNQFLRPAIGDDLIIDARVLRQGKNSAYGEIHVRFEGSGDLVAHSTAQFAF